jgi:hypothetical protein
MADTIDIMDIDGPEFINEVNAQIESIRSHHQDVTLDVSLFNTNYKGISTLPTAKKDIYLQNIKRCPQFFSNCCCRHKLSYIKFGLPSSFIKNSRGKPR